MSRRSRWTAKDWWLLGLVFVLTAFDLAIVLIILQAKEAKQW